MIELPELLTVAVEAVSIRNEVVQSRQPGILTTKGVEGQLRIRVLGTAATELAWVAEGSLDASVVLTNKPWGHQRRRSHSARSWRIRTQPRRVPANRRARLFHLVAVGT